MLLFATISILTIYAALCVPGLQEAFGKLYTRAVNYDVKAFNNIFTPMSPEYQEKIAESFIAMGKNSAEGVYALQFFISCWYTKSPGTPLNDVIAKEAYLLLFAIFQENCFRDHIALIHDVVTSLETTSYSLFRLWLDAKMNINARNLASQTVLHLAIKLNNYNYVDLLINAGANINACDVNGKSPLDYAFALETDSAMIIKLFQKVTLEDACPAIVSVFNTERDCLIQCVVKEIYRSLTAQRHRLCQRELLSRRNHDELKRWLRRLDDFLSIWDDLLKNIFVTHTHTDVLVHSDATSANVMVVETIDQLYRLLTGGGPKTRLSDSSTSTAQDMMIEIALLGSGILTPDRVGRVKVNPKTHSAGSVRFEVLSSDTSDKETISSVVCDTSDEGTIPSVVCDTSDEGAISSVAAVCSGGGPLNVAELSNVAEQNPGIRGGFDSCEFFDDSRFSEVSSDSCEASSPSEVSIGRSRAQSPETCVSPPLVRHVPRQLLAHVPGESLAPWMQRHDVIDYSHRSKSPVKRQAYTQTRAQQTALSMNERRVEVMRIALNQAAKSTASELANPRRANQV